MRENVIVPAGTWDIDPGHSEVSFAVRCMMVGEVRGRFNSFSGVIVTTPNLLDSSVTASIDLFSISTGNDQCDERIRSDFLNVADHPVMSYRSTRICDYGANLVVEGWLTLHGAVQFVPLELEISGISTDAHGGTRTGFLAAGVINRSDFGIDIAPPPGGRGPMVSDEIQIQVEIQSVLRGAPDVSVTPGQAAANPVPDRGGSRCR
jgi:polyisoprenoid-binding protein YceI